jgi:hypothetical protein
MKLTEIHLVGNHDTKRYTYSDFDVADSTDIGFSEGGTIIRKSVNTKDQRIIMYSLHDKNSELLSSVVGYFYPHAGVEYFVVLDVFTIDIHRRKGYATALYVSLVKKYGVKLMSDKHQTEGGKRLWDNINNVLNVNVLDVATGNKIPRAEISDQEIYLDHADSYLLIAEHVPSIIESVGRPLAGDGIVDDYLVFTHPDNDGKYE